MSATDTPATAPPRELRRSPDDRVLAGVAGGLGQYFDLSPAFFRVGFVILALVGGAGILLYVAAAIVIPNEGETESIATEALKRHRDRPWLLAGVALVGLATASLVAQADFWPDSGVAWTLLLLGALAIVIAQRGRDDADRAASAGGDAEPRRRRPSLFLPVFGALVAGAGAVAIVDAAGADIRWDVALGVGAVLVGLAVAAGAILQRRTGALAVVGVVLAALAVAISAIDIDLDGPVGERTYRPISSGDVRDEYHLGVGDLEVDLRNTALDDDTRIDANVGVGELTIVVPPGVDVVGEASVGAGYVNAFGREEDGFGADVVFGEEGRAATTVTIDAHVGAGAVKVEREP